MPQRTLDQWLVHDATYKQSRFCPDCGAKTIAACPECESAIPGGSMDPLSFSIPKVPGFCVHCGNPLPWTAAVLASADELIDLIDDLKPEQKQALKSCLPDLITDTPGTQVAAIKAGKLLASVPDHFKEAFRQITYSLIAAKVQAILKGFGL